MMRRMSDVPPRRSAFPWYLASSSLWLGGMSLQGILVPWMLLGMLETTPAQYSLSRVLIELPPIVALFAGGLLADRTDARRLLIALSVAACLPPLLMGRATPGFWAVVCFGMAMSTLQSLSDPARQAMLSRISRIDIQRTIVVATVVTSLVGIGGFAVGGQVRTLGLERALMIEAALFAVGIAALARLPAQPASLGGRPHLLAGFTALRRLPVVRNIVGLNFLSSLFNAGAYTVAMPFVVTQVYDGDAAFLANMFIAFTIGSIGSNVVLLLVMPLLRPGRLYSLLQLTRIVILALLFVKPPVWMFFALVFAWGLNMGVTSTLVRTTVQELAPAPVRAQVLAILLFSFMLGAPLSAALLGQIVQATDPLTALLPGIPVSLAIFLAGAFGSGLWSYRAPSHPAADAR